MRTVIKGASICFRQKGDTLCTRTKQTNKRAVSKRHLHRSNQGDLHLQSFATVLHEARSTQALPGRNVWLPSRWFS